MRALISFVTRFVPRHQLQRVAHIGLQMVSPFFRGSRYEDPINGRRYWKFLSYGRMERSRPNAWRLIRSASSAIGPWMYLNEHSDFFTGDRAGRCFTSLRSIAF